MKEIFLKYSKYNYWSNELLLCLIEKEINDKLLDKEIVSSFSSLRKTIYHIWGAEHIWLKRLSGESIIDWPAKNFIWTFSEAKVKMLAIDKDFIEFIESLDDKKLATQFSYKNIEGKEFTNPVWESIHHCMNHSTYHRGQVVTILRQLGITNIPSTDFISYCRIC